MRLKHVKMFETSCDETTCTMDMKPDEGTLSVADQTSSTHREQHVKTPGSSFS